MGLLDTHEGVDENDPLIMGHSGAAAAGSAPHEHHAPLDGGDDGRLYEPDAHGDPFLNEAYAPATDPHVEPSPLAQQPSFSQRAGGRGRLAPPPLKAPRTVPPTGLDALGAGHAYGDDPVYDGASGSPSPSPFNQPPQTYRGLPRNYPSQAPSRPR